MQAHSLRRQAEQQKATISPSRRGSLPQEDPDALPIRFTPRQQPLPLTTAPPADKLTAPPADTTTN